MTITLTPEQLAWIEARIGTGEFPSVDDAIRTLVDVGIAGLEAEEEDDLAWAKPLVEEAEAELAAGKFYTLEEHRERMNAVLRNLKG